MHTGPAATRPGTDQPILFDPDHHEHAHDRPVPFHLTARGRRLVDPAAPDLRLVRGVDASVSSHGSTDEPRDPTAAGPGTASHGPPPVGAQAGNDARVDRELDDLDGPTHARVRALRRAGTPADAIAQRVGLDPLTLAVFRATDPAIGTRVVDPEARERAGSGPTGASRTDAPTSRAGIDGRSASLHGSHRHVRALALLAAVGEIDRTGFGITTNRIAVAATLVHWLRQDCGMRATAVRVVVRVADTATADLVAAAWADRLGLGRDRVATVPWRSAPGPRDVQAVVRVTDPGLATDLAAQLDGWPDR